MITILLISYYYFGYFHKQPSNYKYYTAKEAKQIGDIYSHNWNENSVFIEIRSVGEMVAKGKFKSWIAVYSIKNVIGNHSESIEFKILSENNVIRIERPLSLFWGSSSDNWSIDSPQAYEIAISNNEIKKWFAEYEDANIDIMSLGLNLEFSLNPIWYIHWNHQGFFDNPHSAWIVIDAKNGQILEICKQD